jgi:hypothetical protein
MAVLSLDGDWMGPMLGLRGCTGTLEDAAMVLRWTWELLATEWAIVLVLGANSLCTKSNQKPVARIANPDHG